MIRTWHACGRFPSLVLVSNDPDKLALKICGGGRAFHPPSKFAAAAAAAAAASIEPIALVVLQYLCRRIIVTMIMF